MEYLEKQSMETKSRLVVAWGWVLGENGVAANDYEVLGEGEQGMESGGWGKCSKMDCVDCTTSLWLQKKLFSCTF